MIRIAVDAYGGDNAPLSVVQGAVDAVNEIKDLSVTLFGREEELNGLLAGKTYDKERLFIVHAPDEITNHDHPTMAIRRKLDSSMVKALDSVKKGECDGMVTSGSTGAFLAGGIFRVGRIRGIDRPALAPVMPTAKGSPVILVDSGANADCKPEYLPQFALMGTAYMKGVMGISDPRVGLLNIGAEEEKGNELCKNAHPLLKETKGIDFVGNVEARDGLAGDVQVIVCDGFSGNVFLKATEGAAMMIMGMLKQNLLSSLKSKIGALLAKDAFKKVKNSMDSEQYGGAVLLGVNGALIKAHGSSKAKGIASAIAQAYTMVQNDVLSSIRRELEAQEIKEDTPNV